VKSVALFRTWRCSDVAAQYQLAQAFSCFSGWFKGDICGQENGAGDSLGTRLPTSYMGNMGKHDSFFLIVSTSL